MKPPPDDPAFARFTDAMREIVKVSKVELQRREAEWKRARTSASRVPAGRPKRAT